MYYPATLSWWRKPDTSCFSKQTTCAERCWRWKEWISWWLYLFNFCYSQILIKFHLNLNFFSPQDLHSLTIWLHKSLKSFENSPACSKVSHWSLSEISLTSEISHLPYGSTGKKDGEGWFFLYRGANILCWVYFCWSTFCGRVRIQQGMLKEAHSDPNQHLSLYSWDFNFWGGFEY